MKNAKFEGWYFKHQTRNDIVAFIPGISGSGAFVQVILPGGTHYFSVSQLYVENGIIFAGDCTFSSSGCKIKLPGICGEIVYSGITPLSSDIMGPFRFFPMECRHGVISMSHLLSGSIEAGGKIYCFDGGKGYIEKDSGVSFPQFYQWLQCNDFTGNGAFMISVARIPFCGLHFTGCICAVMYEGCEYRLATYCGAHIQAADETHICLSQRGLRLMVDIFPSGEKKPLKSPVCGCMTGTVRENTNVGVHIRLREKKRLILDLQSRNAAYEYFKLGKASVLNK